jgi:2'-5' RNA ligase
MRAFIAIKLPLEIQTYLVKIQNKLKTTLPKIAWAIPSNLHFSLKFLGNISLEKLNLTQQTITKVIKTATPGEIKLETLEVFPGYRGARVIWIGTNQPPA